MRAVDDEAAAKASTKDKDTMNNELTSPVHQNAEVEMEENELETLAAGLPVNSGLKGGRNTIAPCY